MDRNNEHRVLLEKVVTYVQIINTNDHDSMATFRRLGFGERLSRTVSSVLALFGGAFDAGIDFDFFFTMTPLRAAFVGFFAGTGALFGAATDADSTAATGAGVLTITFAATALYRGYARRVVSA